MELRKGAKEREGLVGARLFEKAAVGEVKVLEGDGFECWSSHI